MLRLILVLNYLFLTVLCVPSPQKCKPDNACTTKVTSELYKSLFEDESNHLIPIHNKLVIGELETIQYKLKNITTFGFEKCVVQNANLDLEKSLLEVDMYCPEYHIKGKYEMKGHVYDLLVYGNGDLDVECKAYSVKLKKYLTVSKKNGKHYIHINNFDIKPEALEAIVFNFENLYDGKKEMADKFLAYANKEWKQVATLLEGPLFKANYEKITIATNKLLKDLPLEQYFEL